MPRDGAIIFSNLIGKLDILRVRCEKCGREWIGSEFARGGWITRLGGENGGSWRGSWKKEP
jgi:hypothetical protein